MTLPAAQWGTPAVIPVEHITVPSKRMRALRPEKVAEIAESIKARGLLQPPDVRRAEKGSGYILVTGKHRYEAVRKLGFNDIRVIVLDGLDADTALLAEIDENLVRAELSPAERALHIGERKRLYEKLHPKTKHGGDRKSAKAKSSRQNGDLKRFTEDAAKTTGKSERSVQREVERGAKVVVLPDIIGTSLDQGDEIDALGKLPEHEQRQVVDRVKGGEKVSAKDRLKQFVREQRERPEDSPEPAPSGKTTIVITHTGKQASYPLPKGNVTFNKTNEQVGWAWWSWNLVTGCLHACPYCYAREGAVVNPNLSKHYPFGFEPTLYEYRLDAPANTKVPEAAKDDPRWGRVFVSSMGDLFGKWVPDEWIAKVMAKCIENPQWEYLFLTKFPKRYVELMKLGLLPPTAWIGTSVDNQDRVKYAEDAFRQISGVRRKWLSLEPLLKPLEFTDLSMFDWVVIGAQSATHQPGGVYVPEFAPPFEWIARLTDQAHKAGCRVWQKHNLLGIPNSQSPGMKLIQEEPILRNLTAPADGASARDIDTNGGEADERGRATS
jgi:protein gp37